MQALLQQATTTLQGELDVPGVTSPAKATSAPAAGGASTSHTPGSPSATATPTVSSALLCVRFRALVEPQLAPILAELAQRASQAEYNRLLRNIEGSFCAERVGLILPFVRQHISKIQSSQDLQNMSRCAPRTCAGAACCVSALYCPCAWRATWIVWNSRTELEATSCL